MVNYLSLMDPSTRAIISALLKVVIWVLPVIIVIKRIENRSPLAYLGLRSNFNKGLKWAGVASFVLVLYFIGINLIMMENEININIGFNTLLNAVILAGILEELVFRGFILTKLSSIFKFWQANSITSLLFVFIHFPIWLRMGLFESPHVIGIIINIFVVSLIFGLIFKRTGSLWSVMIIHAVYNLGVSIF